MSNEKGLEDRLKDYIYYAVSRVDFFDMLIKRMVDYSILMITVILSIITIINTITQDYNIILLFIFSIPSLFCFFGNLIYYMVQNKTELGGNPEHWKTMWFYKGRRLRKSKDLKKGLIFNREADFYKEIKDLNQNNKFLEDDKKQLFILYCYESRYFEIAEKMRRFFLCGFFLIFLPFLILLF